MKENIECAREVLQLLSPHKLCFTGSPAALPPELQNQVTVVHGLEALASPLQSEVGYFALEAKLEQLQSQAYGVIFAEAADKAIAAQLKIMEAEILAFPWINVIGSHLDVGDDVEAQLVSFVAVRLAFGKSHAFIENCLRIFHAGLWPFGWDEKNRKYLVFSAEDA